jgi:hypothetical protein
VQKELDKVCGANAERLPQYSDVEAMPIIYAVIKEVMRWRPNLSEAGFPHALTEDMEFEGYHFQKGTVFSWNSYHITMNPDEYENPAAFVPERYINEHVYDVLEGQWGFGAGKPCPEDQANSQADVSVPDMPSQQGICSSSSLDCSIALISQRILYAHLELVLIYRPIPSTPCTFLRRLMPRHRSK